MPAQATSIRVNSSRGSATATAATRIRAVHQYVPQALPPNSGSVGTATTSPLPITISRNTRAAAPDARTGILYARPSRICIRIGHDRAPRHEGGVDPDEDRHRGDAERGERQLTEQRTDLAPLAYHRIDHATDEQCGDRGLEQ